MQKCRDVHANETIKQDCVQVTLFPLTESVLLNPDAADTCCLYSKISSNYIFKDGAISGPTRCGMFLSKILHGVEIIVLGNESTKSLLCNSYYFIMFVP